MKTILLATHNQGKIKRYQALFSCLDNLELLTLNDLNISAKIDEPFATAAENSAHKAQYYGRLSQLPTIAIDEGVTTNFLPDNEQPGVLVRRFRKGTDLTDAEVLNVWTEIFATYENTKHEFIWDYALSFYDPIIDHLKTTQVRVDNLVAQPFSLNINPGYPMSSFLIPSGFSRPYAELNAAENLAVDKNDLKLFLEFVENLL